MSPRPGRIRADLRVDLPLTRTVEEKLAPEFLALKREIVGMLHEGRDTTGTRAAPLAADVHRWRGGGKMS